MAGSKPDNEGWRPGADTLPLLGPGEVVDTDQGQSVGPVLTLPRSSALAGEGGMAAFPLRQAFSTIRPVDSGELSHS